MINNTFITSNLVSDIEEIAKSAYLLEQVQEEKAPQEIVDLLSHFEESLELIIEEIQYLKKSEQSLFRRAKKGIFYECA